MIGDFLRQTARGISGGLNWLNNNKTANSFIRQVPGAGAVVAAAAPIASIANKFIQGTGNVDDAVDGYRAVKRTYEAGRDSYDQTRKVARQVGGQLSGIRDNIRSKNYGGAAAGAYGLGSQAYSRARMI